MRNLNIDKAHGHDNISIPMLKICDSLLVEPLSLIYTNCINSGVILHIWKRSHIIPTYKKKDKRCISNYRPVSLLPICGKIFECILYNPLFLYLESNNLLTPHQSGFRSNDSSYTNYCQLYIAFMQILIITHHLKFEEIFWISQKRSTKYDMKVYYTNLNLLVFQEIFLTYFAVSLMIDIKE